MHYVYVMIHHSGALAIGNTEDLINIQEREVAENAVREPINPPKLLYFERFQKSREAQAREEDIRGWAFSKIRELIDFVNPEWYDLASDRPQLQEALFRY